MKKFIAFIIFSVSVLLLTGCSSDKMEDITIYTSVYPIEYVTNELYGNYSTIYNMYPQGIDPFEYKFDSRGHKLLTPVYASPLYPLIADKFFNIISYPIVTVEL